MAIATTRFLPTCLAVLLAFALVACSDSRTAQRSIALEDCRLPKLATAAKCGTVEVPEDRGEPDARRIGIFVAVLPANTL